MIGIVLALAGKLVRSLALCDAAERCQLGFQDAATSMMQGIIDLHHDIFFFLILISVFVIWILARALWHFHYKRNPIPQRIVHGTTIEILWTIFPSIILMFIAIPSFALLYSMDEVVVDPAITIKAIGHQGYWTYEYSDYNSSDEESLTFDSYMISEEDLDLGQLRLLEVDNRVVVPANSHLRMIVTSADVLHSWAVPSLDVKCDAVPGRLNQISTFLQNLLAPKIAFASDDERALVEFPRAVGNHPRPFISSLLDPLENNEDERKRQLYEKMTGHLLGRNCFSSLTKSMERVELQFIIEMSVESALKFAGVDPAEIVSRRRNVRDILFYNKDQMISSATLKKYIECMDREGTPLSLPYKRIQREHIFLGLTR